MGLGEILIGNVIEHEELFFIESFNYECLVVFWGDIRAFVGGIQLWKRSKPDDDLNLFLSIEFT